MKKYQIIYADPPWKYVKLNMYDKKGINKEVYNRMEFEDICNLSIRDICDENCLLFLWTTSPFIKKAINVMESWGFKFSTIAFVWVKTYKNGRTITGMGRYTRSAVELVLLGRKGVGTKRVDTNVHQVLFSDLTRHSAKPEEIRNRIVQLCGNVPRIELFAREKINGWDVWGNEVESDIDFSLYKEKKK